MSADDAALPVPPMIRQGELTSEIARLILAAVDGEWTTVVYDHRMLTTLSQSQMTIERPNGPDRSRLPGREIGDLVDELRDVMYQDHKGTWFSAQWVLINKDGAVESNVSFNYDDEPAWSRPIDAANYADDIEDFPRSEEFIPAWLRGRLQEAGA